MKYSFTISPVAGDATAFASNVTGAGPWTPTTEATTDGLGHLVTIRNDSATDHSAKTVTITGEDPNGTTQVQVISAPGTSATVTSTAFFKKVTSVAVSATIGASTFDIGTATGAVTSDITVNPENNLQPIATVVQTGTCGWDIAGTLEEDTTYVSRTYTNDSAFTAKSATTANTALGTRARKVRFEINSLSSTPSLAVTLWAPGV